MTLSEFRPLLLAKSLSRTTLPPDVDLKERIFAGLKLIAKETLPLRLITTDPVGFTILRKLDSEWKTTVGLVTTTNAGMYVRMPSIPTSEDTELDMDLALMDALAYYVMAGLERGNANTLMGMYHGEIDMNNDRLIETVLSDTTNDSCKFCQFP